MLSWQVDQRRPIEENPLKLSETELDLQPDEILVDVTCCGVCRTDLHVIEGDLPVHLSPVTPGHEVVGSVAKTFNSSKYKVGQKVGIAWLQSTCLTCKYCRAGKENLCSNPIFTGYDVNGGYATQIAAKTQFIYEIPESFEDKFFAPLLCSGIIGYRAFKLAHPEPASTLGIYGFGASAHIIAQIAIKLGYDIYVITRSEKGQQLAKQLGASYVGSPSSKVPNVMDNALVFAPAGEIAAHALQYTDRGGKVVMAGIYATDLPSMNYSTHLFYEKSLTSATANTYIDGQELITLASRLNVKPIIEEFSFSDVPTALRYLKEGKLKAAAVIIN